MDNAIEGERLQQVVTGSLGSFPVGRQVEFEGSTISIPITVQLKNGWISTEEVDFAAFMRLELDRRVVNQLGRTQFEFNIAVWELHGRSELLSALGTYGLVSYAAQQSTREIGIRMAVGANRTDVLARFFGRGVRFGVIGALIGLAASLVASRALASLIYGIAATDAVSFSLASLAVLAVVAAASLVPAWRAARIDPITALRQS